MTLALEPAAALIWDSARLAVLDQTELPHREVWLDCRSADDVAEAIRRLAVRGAPNIGIAAAYGVALELARVPDAWRDGVGRLRGCRPTAVNLAWAVDRVLAAAEISDPSAAAAVARSAAEALHAAEDLATHRIASLGADLLQAAGARRVLTHCNTGTLACAAGGTALGAALQLAAREEGVEVLAAETRPLLQGARLTIWELARAGVDHALVADGAAAGLIARGEVDAVVIGCDRVAANGDTANKVGSYAHALAAAAAGIPFIVLGPTSSVDLTLAGGGEIRIEERDADEVRRAPGGELLTLPGTRVRNPAFDVTPASLITALVTERGVARPVTPASVAAICG